MESERQGADSSLREERLICMNRQVIPSTGEDWIRSSSLVLSSHPRQYLCSLPASCILCQINRAGYGSLACVCRHETQHCILVLALSGTFVQYARNVLGLLRMSVETVSFQFCSKQHSSLFICLCTVHVQNRPLCDYI